MPVWTYQSLHYLGHFKNIDDDDDDMMILVLVDDGP